MHSVVTMSTLLLCQHVPVTERRRHAGHESQADTLAGLAAALAAIYCISHLAANRVPFAEHALLLVTQNSP